MDALRGPRRPRWVILAHGVSEALAERTARRAGRGLVRELVRELLAEHTVMGFPIGWCHVPAGQGFIFDGPPPATASPLAPLGAGP